MLEFFAGILACALVLLGFDLLSQWMEARSRVIAARRRAAWAARDARWPGQANARQ